MNDRITISMYHLLKRFPNNESARKHLESARWGDGRVCPICGSVRTISRKTRPGYYICNECHKEFTVRTNSVFAHSNVGLDKWLLAIYLMVTARKGISSMQLSKELDITQKTAWYLEQRIRIAMGSRKEMDMLKGVVEIDETYIGGKEANKHSSKKLREGRGSVGKIPVVGVVERRGKVKAFVVPNTKMETLNGVLLSNVAQGSVVNTDEFLGYGSVSDMGYVHNKVNHSAKLFVDGQACTNGIESVWSLLKRGFYGTFHKFSMKHLQHYVDEFDFRWNDGNCKIPTSDRMNSLIGGAWNCGTDYRTFAQGTKAVVRSFVV